MTNTQTDDEIKVMFHAQVLDNGDLRCLYNWHRAIGSSVCQHVFAAGTPERRQAYEAAQASGVLAVRFYDLVLED